MKKHVYDNTNITESYAGVTTPLTLSFVRRVYREVYLHFCDVMGVEKSKIEKHRDIFTRMVVPIGFRLYYDLRSWYTMISWLPGYRFNQDFFNRMLGVEQSTVGHTLTASDSSNALVERARVFGQAWRGVGTLLMMGHSVRNFIRDFDCRFTEQQSIELKNLSWSQLKDFYFSNTDTFLAMWRIPIGNDFATMISTGILRRLADRWRVGNDLYDHLTVGVTQQVVSLDPGRLLDQIAAAVNLLPELQQLCASSVPVGTITLALRGQYAQSEPGRMYAEYLERFGQRIPNELKLETLTMTENPDFLTTMILARLHRRASPLATSSIEPSIREVRLHWWQRLVWNVAVTWSRTSIARREETRLRRTMIFGLVRKTYLEVGRRLHNKGRLDDQRDIFWLTMEEIWEIEKETNEVIQQRIESRRQLQAEWRDRPMPRRIETDNSPAETEQELLTTTASKAPPIAQQKFMSGMVVARTSADKISGPSLVVKEFDPRLDFSDKILVTRQTDPGWTIVFPVLRGLIVERGGMLSHAAIVARELGIPCIVGVDGATDLIITGANVTMDLQTGNVTI